MCPYSGRLGERGRELRAAVESVVSLAGLDLDILGPDLSVLLLSKGGDGRALGLEPEAKAPAQSCATSKPAA